VFRPELFFMCQLFGRLLRQRLLRAKTSRNKKSQEVARWVGNQGCWGPVFNERWSGLAWVGGGFVIVGVPDFRRAAEAFDCHST